MPKYDERTSRGWPLPHQANKLLDDVERLRKALRSIDKELNSLEERARIIADEHIAPIEDRQDLLDTRMDVIAGQATEDTEILDGRVDAKAEVHPNLGHNIRSLHKQVIGLDEDVKYETVERQGLMKQFNELAQAQLQGEVNAISAYNRRKEEIQQEALTRGEQDDGLQEQVNSLAQAILNAVLNARHEAEQRRKGLEHAHRQLDERLEYDEYLQTQIDNLIRAIVRSSIIFHSALDCRRAALNQETQSRIDDDANLQAQINSLAQTSMQNALNLAHEVECRRKLEQVIAEDKCPVDWSKAESLQIPEPRCAVVNFTGLKSMPTSKTAEIKAFMEFWDMQGNYFKKPIVCSAQGSSSLSYVKKNVKFDLLNDDGEEFDLKIGNWVVQDGFHLKAYYTDFFRGVGVTSYKLWDEIMETRPYKKALVDVEGMNTTANGVGNVSDLTLQFDTGALCHPDGFPCIVYLNGEFYGVYSWQIKKQRKNYHMDKSTVEHIHLDGSLYTQYFWNGTINWTTFEIRNPNKLYTMDGKKYDGDAPRELIDETSENYKPGNKDHVRSATVKRYIHNLVQRFGELKQIYSTYRVSDPDRVKAAYEEIFDWENMRDYLIFSDVIKNSDGFGKNWQWTTYDGVKWYVNAYGLDMSFGGHWQGIQITPPLTGHITTSTALPVYYVALLYKAELEARYRELREAGIIDVEHIVSKLADWTARIGEKNYELEYKRWPNSPCILNYRDSVDRVRKWLTIEIANMDKLYKYQPESELENLKLDFRKALSIEAEAREIHDISETRDRLDETGTLQSQINDLAIVQLQSGLRSLKNHACRKNEIEHERHVRLEQDDGLQSQIDTLANANIRLIMNGLEGRRRIIAEINDLKETIDSMYQAVADIGNLTYKGAGVASSREIREMLNDVLTGTESETTASEIPEELRDQVATSSEINEMLDEIIPNRTNRN